MSHFVYFVGGPLDLTKRAFPGESPSTRYLRFPAYPNTATYELLPLRTASGERVWIATEADR